MVSFGFTGTPNVIGLEEYQSLSRFGFDSVGDISEKFQNDYYVFLPSGYGGHLPNNEKKVTNICRFLEVDSVVEPGQNSILNINLKADVVLICGDKVVYFQAKSSMVGASKYIEKYANWQLNPFFSRSSDNILEEQFRHIKESYLAPGVVYLDTKHGASTLPTFLKEFSEWIGIPVRDGYQKLLGVIQKSPKPISIRVLQKIFHDSNVMKSVTHLSSIHPISIVQGDCVHYIRQRQAQIINQ
jgi:hypothetical protein